ncbi:MAG: entericidin A/B family lipoprotein [Paracoccaceae bacterium]
MTRIALLLATVLSLSACQTMQGLGKDVQTAGEALEEEAVEAQ